MKKMTFSLLVGKRLIFHNMELKMLKSYSIIRHSIYFTSMKWILPSKDTKKEYLPIRGLFLLIREYSPVVRLRINISYLMM